VLKVSSAGWHTDRHDPWPAINYFLYTLLDAYREFERRAGDTAAPRGAKAELVRSAVRSQRGEFRLIDVERLCPGVGRDWIRSLLAELRERGEVACRGKGPGARWHLLSNKGSTLK